MEIPVRRVPEVKITVKKEVVARFTHSLTGTECVIYGDWDPVTEKYNSIGVRGDDSNLYKTENGSWNYTTNVTDDKIAALHEMDAGDRIVYRIYLINEGDTDFDGNVYDFHPFRGNPATTYQQTVNSVDYSYFKYQAAGLSSYIGKDIGDVYKYSYGVTNDPNITDDINVGANDFAIKGNMVSGNGPIVYEFTGEKAIKSGSTYVQSATLIVPGDNTKAITKSDYANTAFEKIVSAHSNCPKQYREKDLGNCAAYTFSSSPTTYHFSNNVYHKLAGQLSIDTGVVATSNVTDINHIESGQMRVCYGGYGGSDRWKDYPESDLHTFEAKSTQTIVNYVYVFNDSDKPLRLDANKGTSYSIYFSVPKGFKILGLTNFKGYDGGPRGYYVTLDKPSSSAIVGTDNVYWLRGQSHRTTDGRFEWSYYPSDQFVGVQFSDISSGYHGYASYYSYNDNERGQLSLSGVKELPPYTGLRFYYVAAVTDYAKAAEYTQSNPAKFTAEIVANRGNVPRMSPVVKVAESQGNARNRLEAGFDNPGVMSSYDVKSGTWVDTNDGPGMPVSEGRMRAGVSLYERTEETYKVEVYKEVVKNSGEDSKTQYRTKNVYNVDDLTPSYDNYYWGYPLHDGVHRTVDGTVTWRSTIKNTGTKGCESSINYGLLSDTIDSPYELAEIKIPELICRTDGGSKQILENQIFKLPLGDEGWDKVGEGIHVYTYDLGAKQKADTSESGLFTAPRIRVTRKFVDEGSIATGYDVSYGDKNVDAYRYIIEISDLSDQGLIYKPLLEVGESVDFYLTFATTDSIETNYNSFSLLMPGINTDNITVTKGNKITIAETHKGQGTVADGSSDTSGKASANPVADENLLRSKSSAAEQLSDERLLAVGSLAVTRAANGSGFATGGSYATEASDPDTIAIEYNDWTDTSYTDALKTVTVKNPDGSDGTSINSRADGNMVLPEKVLPGSLIHTQLAVESVIYEAEDYDKYDNLVIYDLYGMSSKYTQTPPKDLCGYEVNFESIKVKGVKGKKGEPGYIEKEYKLGEDYDIYYTAENLVYNEHLNTAPLNSLQYAADIERLQTDKDPNASGEKIQWDLYEGGKVDPAKAHAFKVVFKENKGVVYNDRYVSVPEGELSGYCNIFVDFDATVPKDLRAPSGRCQYPNVEAYSADMHVISDPSEVKPFFEDTTAITYELTSFDDISFLKKIEAAEGVNPPKDEKFTYLILRVPRWIIENGTTTRFKTDIINPEDVQAAAKITVEPDKKYNMFLDMDLIYKDNDKVQDKNGFFDFRNAQYLFFEVDSGSFAYKEIKGEGRYLEFTDVNSTLNLSELETGDDAINSILSSTDGDSYKGLCVTQTGPVPDRYTMALESTNIFDKGNVRIVKIDEDGVVIEKPVTFKLADKDGNIISFSKNDDSYVFDKEGDITEMTFPTGEGAIRNLDPGTYNLIEVTPPDGYKLIEGGSVEIKVRSSAGDEVQTIKVADPVDEDVRSGAFELKKIDADTKEAITADKAFFEVYNSKDAGAKPLTFIKDENGTFKYSAQSSGKYYTELDTTDGMLHAEDLPFGTYYLVETQAPGGYNLSGDTLDTAKEVTISRNKETEAVVISNAKIDGRINLVKVDADDEKPIVGSQATFNIQSEDGAVLKFKEKTEGTDGAYVYDAEGEITDLKTNSTTGKLEVTGLPQGEYAAVETKAPVGYKVNSEGTSFEIKDNSLQTVTVSDETAEAALKLVKKWRLEGGRKARPLADVEFTLYKLDEETKTAESIGTKTTDENGELKFEDLDWKATYYISEKVPAGYTLGASTSKAYVDANGAIDFNVTEPTDGYTEIEVIKVNMKGGLEEIDNEFVYTEDVLNIKNMVYGGMYGSVSYKTIDNKKAAAEYEGLEERTGYGFYYTNQDYAEGNYNYVDAVNPGDIVTYTLNVSNVSDYDFGRFAIIDRLPETGDTGVVNLKEKRDSEFTVSNSDGEFKVEVDGKVVDPSMYEVSFSDKVEFTNGDFNGTTTWDGTYADAKSVRIAFADDFILEPGQTVVVTFDGKISDEAKPDQFAWNDFAYRYTAITEEAPEPKAAKGGDDDKVVTKSAKANGKSKDVVITPEPPKVGVRIVEGKTVIGGEKKYECSESSRKDTETFTFTLTRSDDLDYGVTYKDKSGKLAEFPDEGLTVNVKATLNGKAVKFEFPELHFSHTGKYEFDVREVADESKLITFDTSEYHVVVDGTNAAEYTSEDGITPVYTLDGEEAAAASFTNTKKAFGDLEVSKKAENAGKADKNTEFSFNIELTTVTGDPYEDEVSYVKGSEKGTLTPEDGVITIKLKAGEKAVFKDLPAGVKYNVTESKIPDRWTLIRISGASGVIRDSEKATAEFTNKYTPEEIRGECNILISKVDDHRKAISGAVFEVYRIGKDSKTRLSHNDYSWLDSNDRFTVGKEAFSLTDLEDGTYEIREVRAPEGYRIRSEFPIGFTIQNGKLRGDAIVMSSNVGYEMVSDDAHKFTVVNDKTGVKTGDSNNILIPLAVMLSAMLTLLIIAERRRRKA